MKKVILSLLMVVGLFATNNLFAQEYKKFKVGTGLFYSASMDDAFSSGIGLYVEPKYNITDNIAAGVYYGLAFTGSVDAETGDVSAATVTPILLTGEYYFNTKKVRPYAGIGLGFYNRAAIEITGETILTEENGVAEGGASNFGFAPKAGVLLGHFDLSLTYNVTGEGIGDYLGINLGFNIGGGKL